jgi:molybdopterin-guanine dinucleotide biosynthesis protein A
MARQPDVIGVILAGGSGRRMGGAKATVHLRGRPLISYALEAVWRALGAAVVVAKADTELPNLPGVTVWVEPDEIRHPLVGLRYALEMADGRPVLACAADLPFVTPRLVRELADGAPRRAPALIAAAGGQIQPLLGWYHPRALAQLRRIDPGSGVSLREAVTRLAPAKLEVDPELLFNVNTPSDLLQATALIDQWMREDPA